MVSRSRHTSAAFLSEGKRYGPCQMVLCPSTWHSDRCIDLSDSFSTAQDDGTIFLHNHLRFTILYHRDVETDLSRIVGFEVEPFSVKHKYDGKWNADRPELKTCNSNSMKFVSEKDPKQEVKEGEEVVFTYDVSFKVRIAPMQMHDRTSSISEA